MFTIQNFLDKIRDEKIDVSLPMAVVGHYGEVHHLDSFDFRVRECYDEIPLNKQMPWTGRKERIQLEVLEVSPPDIGEEPD